MPNFTAFFENGTQCEFSTIDNLHAYKLPVCW